MTDPAAPTTPRELRGRIGSCTEHGAAAEFYDDGSGQCLYCCQVETSCDCTEARSTPAEPDFDNEPQPSALSKPATDPAAPTPPRKYESALKSWLMDIGRRYNESVSDPHDPSGDPRTRRG